MACHHRHNNRHLAFKHALVDPIARANAGLPGCALRAIACLPMRRGFEVRSNQTFQLHQVHGRLAIAPAGYCVSYAALVSVPAAGAFRRGYFFSNSNEVVMTSGKTDGMLDFMLNHNNFKVHENTHNRHFSFVKKGKTLGFIWFKHALGGWNLMLNGTREQKVIETKDELRSILGL
jgi:hypothetical protein